LAVAISNKATSCRGILFEGNSGWGKSSCALSAVHDLQTLGHHAVVIDSRSASSAQFILRVVEHVMTRLATAKVKSSYILGEERITGFDGAADKLIAVGNQLRNDGRLLWIFLDKFENL